MLLEIITGRKPLPNSDPKSCVTNWVSSSLFLHKFMLSLITRSICSKPSDVSVWLRSSNPVCLDIILYFQVEKTYGNGSTKAVKAVADPLFNHNFNPKAMKLVINLARSCIKTSGEDRPVISEVVRVLRKAQTLELGEKKSWTFL